MPRFTDRYLRTLKPRSQPYFVRDESYPGLAVRVTKTKKTFYCIQKINGKKKYTNLGLYPAVVLKTARSYWANRQHKDIALQLPNDDGDSDLNSAPLLLTEAIKRFESDYMRQRLKLTTIRGYLRWLNAISDRLDDPPVRDIQRKDLKALFKTVALEEGKIHTSNRMRECLGSLCSWLVDEEELQQNPCCGIRKYPEKPKDNYLNDSELKVLFRELSNSECFQVVKCALITCLLTCARSSEVTGMRIEELELDKAQWIISADRSKNGKSVLIPLVSSLVDTIRSLIGQRTHGFVFPSPGSSSTALSGFTLLQALRRLCIRAGIRYATIHDLRRTGATQLGALGVNGGVISALLNHAANDITGRVYNLYGYEKEKAEALSHLLEHYNFLGLNMKAVCIPINL